MIYNDFLGAAVSFVANALGWLTLAAIVAAGFWVSGRNRVCGAHIGVAERGQTFSRK